MSTLPVSTILTSVQPSASVMEPATPTRTRKPRFPAHSNSTLSLSLPEFSSPLKQRLENGKTREVWAEMLRELTDFYENLDQYQAEGFHAFSKVGELMFKAYPSIARTGLHPWVRTTDHRILHFL